MTRMQGGSQHASLFRPPSGASLRRVWTERIADGQFLVFPFFIPAGTNEADFELAWKGNWGHYPTNDLDLILLRPDRRLDFSGATFNSPDDLGEEIGRAHV